MLARYNELIFRYNELNFVKMTQEMHGFFLLQNIDMYVHIFCYKNLKLYFLFWITQFDID